MEKYEHEGLLFKAIRESRKLSLKRVADGICDRTTIQKFEKSGNNMGFITFYKLIQRMGVTLAEFQQEMNDYELDDLKWLMTEIGNYYDSRDIDGLRSITSQLEREVEPNDKLTYTKMNYLMAKILLSYIDDEVELSTHDKENITGYLIFNEHWGFFELTLFGNTMKALPLEDLLDLTKQIIIRSDFYQSIAENKSLTIQISLNAMKEFIARRKYEMAREISQSIKEILDEGQAYYKLVHMFVLGSLEFSMDNYELGIKLMKQAIQILEVLKEHKLVNDYRRTYNVAVRHLEEKGIELG